MILNLWLDCFVLFLLCFHLLFVTLSTTGGSADAQRLVKCNLPSDCKPLLIRDSDVPLIPPQVLWAPRHVACMLLNLSQRTKRWVVPLLIIVSDAKSSWNGVVLSLNKTSVPHFSSGQYPLSLCIGTTVHLSYPSQALVNINAERATLKTILFQWYRSTYPLYSACLVSMWLRVLLSKRPV